jgi:hypothetical protein
MYHNENLKPFVILALNKETAWEDRKILNSRKLKHKWVWGAYKSQIENSYVVPFRDAEHLNDIMRIARYHNQESILIVDSERNAKLYYLETDKTEDLGQFKAVSKSEAYQHDSYTFDLDTETYYICK